ncbi:MAG: hypothetical protein H6Q19_1264 [Bacteroidetes bacterium]|nr:hypothetical protein [Bacteroidota bacterium]
MEFQNLFFAVIAMLGYVILQSLFILGVRIAADGSTEKLPNGKDKDSEMILYPILKFLCRTKKVPIYYIGAQLDALLKQIKRENPEFNFTIVGEMISLQDTHDIKAFENTLYNLNPNVIIDLNQDNTFKLYIVDEVFVVNKYLRKPIIQCPICMSSFWSIFSYWIPMIYLFGTPLWLFYLGFANICILASLNWLIWIKGNVARAQLLKH